MTSIENKKDSTEENIVNDDNDIKGRESLKEGRDEIPKSVEVSGEEKIPSENETTNVEKVDVVDSPSDKKTEDIIVEQNQPDTNKNTITTAAESVIADVKTVESTIVKCEEKANEPSDNSSPVITVQGEESNLPTINDNEMNKDAEEAVKEKSINEEVKGSTQIV